jgi:nickel-dependent lactate racemase
MTEVSIPFDGKPYVLPIPEENLAEVLTPHPSSPLEDLDAEIEKVLDVPINQEPLEAWVKRLNSVGVVDSQISCIMALGTHRYMTKQEMEAKVGREVYGRIRVFNHEWRNPKALRDMGISRNGTPLIVNKALLDAEVMIGLGMVVPHHIPGFSGSSKIIQPGVCGARTTAETHLLSCSEGGDSFLGLEENPVREEMDDMADRVGLKTIFNVVMNPEGGVVGVFFGEMRETFKKAVEAAREIYGVEYHETPDVVIANSCPCDLDFWQSHKSQYPAQRMVRENGTIIVCTPAPEGVSPVHTDLLSYTSWPSAEIKEAYRKGRLKNGVATALAAAWAMVREKADVIMYSPGIPPEEKAKLGHTHAPTIEWALEEAFRRQGRQARVTVLTHAPEMLPIKGF